jgi:endonuclease/exonuclease/phosphatase (EEP) superfamily protein YafD
MPSVKGLEQPASYDFLNLLLASLAAKGAHYRVAAAQTNFDTTVQLSGIPLPLTYADRDVILVREGSGEPQVTATGHGTFATQLRQQVTAIGRTLDFRRGYVWADLSTGGRRWRIVDTHAEAFPGLTPAAYRDYGGEQATELVTALTPVTTPLVVAGDLNSAAGEQKRKTYSVLVERGRFRDAWVQASKGATGLSCCRNTTLSAGNLSERIDHVLVRGAVTVQKAGEVGVQPDATTAPRWPSDHAGVTATVTIG